MLHGKHAGFNRGALDFFAGGMADDHLLNVLVHLEYFINTHASGIAGVVAFVAAGRVSFVDDELVAMNGWQFAGGSSDRLSFFLGFGRFGFMAVDDVGVGSDFIEDGLGCFYWLLWPNIGFALASALA